MNAVDTNVLIYALDADARQGLRAIQLLERLSTKDTVLPWQVIREAGAVLPKLVARGAEPELLQRGLRALRDRFRIVLPTERVLERGWRVHADAQVSYWDAMLIAACAEAGVTRLYTEDLQGRPNIDGVAIDNPF